MRLPKYLVLKKDYNGDAQVVKTRHEKVTKSDLIPLNRDDIILYKVAGDKIIFRTLKDIRKYFNESIPRCDYTENARQLIDQRDQDE